MTKYDVHVATQGSEDQKFEKELLDLGFSKDKLVSRQVTFLKGVPLSSCPLIGTHMTKKYEKPTQIREDMEKVKSFMENYQQVGYVHGEITSLDNTILSSEPFQVTRPWPVQKLDAQIDNQNKKWDLHIAVPKRKMPEELERTLNFDNSGLYHIELNKTREGEVQPFRIYTMQGISNPQEGRKLWQVLNNWFIDVNAPHVEMKQETYINMFRVGDPLIVPPTVREINYL